MSDPNTTPPASLNPPRPIEPGVIAAVGSVQRTPATEAIAAGGSVQRAPATELEEWATWIIVGLILFVLLLLSADLYHILFVIDPSLPRIAGNDPDSLAKSANMYKIAAEQLRAPYWDLFTGLLDKAIVPLITLLVGYVFGKKSQ